jgi:hypothetical protein
MSDAATLLHKCLQLRRNMSGDDCQQCYFFQICVIGWVGTNCDCMYVKVVFLIFGASASSWLHRKLLFLDVAIIICVCSLLANSKLQYVVCSSC